jgi:hypothetical protein
MLEPRLTLSWLVMEKIEQGPKPNVYYLVARYHMIDFYRSPIELAKIASRGDVSDEISRCIICASGLGLLRYRKIKVKHPCT